MSIRIVSASERQSSANSKTSVAIFGPSGVGKTSLLKTLPAESTLCLDLEAGLKAVQGWQGDSIPLRSFGDFQDLVAMIGGPDAAAASSHWYSEQHVNFVRDQYAESGLESLLASKSIIFVDSITDLTRQAFVYSQQQPDAFSEKTGRPDTRGAYGLLGRVVVRSLKHLQHAPGKTVVFVGILEKHTDDANRVSWLPQMEGSKAGRELPGIVDQVMSMHFFRPDFDNNPIVSETSGDRMLVCQSGNPWGLPAKDRSGNLNALEPPDLGAVLAKINHASH
jgi:hypothetical protein